MIGKSFSLTLSLSLGARHKTPLYGGQLSVGSSTESSNSSSRGCCRRLRRCRGQQWRRRRLRPRGQRRHLRTHTHTRLCQLSISQQLLAESSSSAVGAKKECPSLTYVRAKETDFAGAKKLSKNRGLCVCMYCTTREGGRRKGEGRWPLSLYAHICATNMCVNTTGASGHAEL